MQNPDITNVCVALCAGLIGVYLGYTVPNYEDFDVIKIAGVLISLSLLIIAKQALTTWRDQFRHQERYKSLVNAENAFRRYYEIEERFWYECLRLRREQGEGYDDTTLEAFIEERNSLFRVFNRAWHEFLIHSPDGQKNYPHTVQKSFMEIRQRLRAENYKHELYLPDNEHDSILSEGIKLFQDLRKKC